MWDWLISRRRSSSRRQRTQAGRNVRRHQTDDGVNPDWPFRTNFFQSAGVPCDRLTQYHRNIDYDMENRPKCLQTFSCTDILHGNRMEDFSRDCWLENHLHRFGSPSIQERLVFDYPVPAIPDTETLDLSDDSATGSDDSLGDLPDNATLTDRPRRRLAIEELFHPLDQTGAGDVELFCETPSVYHPDDELPPYSQYPDDPPPSYEEAVGQQVDRQSLRSRHSSELAIMW